MNEWISMDERWPEDNIGGVILTYDGNYYCIYTPRGLQTAAELGWNLKLTHWMPLPPPPEAK